MMIRKTAVVRQTIAGRREQVWAAWTSPEIARVWGAPDELRVATFDSDFRVGGHYRLTMAELGGSRHVVVGQHEAIEVPSRLICSWAWEDRPEPPSRVIVELFDRGESTDVVLRHEGLAPEVVDAHEAGWRSSLGKLAAFFETRVYASQPPASTRSPS